VPTPSTVNGAISSSRFRRGGAELPAPEWREDPGDLELRDYLVVVRRRKGIIVLTTLLVVAAALAFSFAQTAVYAATAEVLLQARPSERIFSPEQGNPQNRMVSVVPTEMEVMRSRSVREAVTEELDGRQPEVAISARGETDVVAITAESTDPAEAVTFANTYASTYIDIRREQLVDDLLGAAEQVQARIEQIDEELDGFVVDEAAAERQALLTQRLAYSQQLDQLQLAGSITGAGGAQVVSQAELPNTPVRPTPLRNAVLALIVGLILGVGLAFLRDNLDDTIKTKEDLERATEGLATLALIPTVATWRDRNTPYVVSRAEPTAPASEAYRALRTSVQFLGLDTPLQMIQVTSANAGEGKTTTLSNLAVVMARADQRVAVVCCDLRRPRVHAFLGLDNAVGLTSVLVGQTSLDDAIQSVPGEENLFLLASGPPPPNPSELLSSARAQSVFEELRERFDVVLVDTSPILPVTDGLIISRLVDATVVVASAKKAHRKSTHRAVEMLRQVDAPLVGAVLNGVEGEGLYGYGLYGYGGYGGYGDDSPGRKELSWPFRRRKLEEVGADDDVAITVR
jgi:polysaccharide biosynthesis transport protein